MSFESEAMSEKFLTFIINSVLVAFHQKFSINYFYLYKVFYIMTVNAVGKRCTTSLSWCFDRYLVRILDMSRLRFYTYFK